MLCATYSASTSSVARLASSPMFAKALEEAAMQCHAGVVQRAEADPDKRRMATTLDSTWAHLVL